MFRKSYVKITESEFKNLLKEIEQEAKQELKDKTQDIRNKYIDLKEELEILQSKYIKVIQENDVLRGRLREIESVDNAGEVLNKYEELNKILGDS